MNSLIISGPDTLPPKPDSLVVSSDSVATDTVVSDTLSIRFAESDLDGPIVYHARDSIVYDLANQLIILYGEAQADYTDISLKAAYIEYDWKESVLFARGIEDSAFNIIEGKPVFTQAERTFTARSLRYNFKTKKGKMYDLYTEESDGFIHAIEAKKDEDDNLFARSAHYTTCDLEHPHFYIDASPVKIAPNKVLVTGPANLVIEDVRTPLVAPFAIFPLKAGQRSGILLPKYGNSSQLGFYLSDGGYYFGMSQYLEASLRGDIYTNGSWRLNANSNFRKIYKYNGNISFGYGRIKAGDELEGDLRLQKDFKVGLTFLLDPKMLPNSALTANVNFATSDFNTYNDFSYDNHLNNTYQSSIRYSKSWPGKPFNFSVNLGHHQNTETHIVDFTLPEATFGISRFYPFKRKVVKGKARWYEKIGLSYNGNAQNRLTIADSLLFTPGFLEKARAGARHTVPLSTSLNLFRFFNVSPSFSYTELWYDEHYDRTFNPDPVDSTTFVEVDTVSGFGAVRFFDMDVSVNTRIYGRLALKKGKFKAIRHVISPTVGARYQPDFGSEAFGYYQKLQKDTLGNVGLFYRYPTIYGPAPYGEFGGITFSVDNQLEMKVFSKKDTISHERKIKLLESLRFSGNYNFAVDSFQLSRISVAARTRLFEAITVNMSATYDPYALDTGGVRINQFEWDVNRRLARLEYASLTLTSGFHSKERVHNQEPTDAYLNYPGEPVRYSDFSFPYQVNISYTLLFDKGIANNPDTTVITQAINASIDFSFTPKWHAQVKTGFDFINRQLGYTVIELQRDLHCWEMNFKWIPLGTVSSYTFGINVKSNILKDLKIEKKSDPLQGVF